jgi:hypothetical protein
MRVMIAAGDLIGEKATLLQRDEQAGTATAVIDGETDSTVLELAALASLHADDDDPDAGTMEWQIRRQDGDCHACLGTLEIVVTDDGPVIVAEADNGWAVHPECVTT